MNEDSVFETGNVRYKQRVIGGKTFLVFHEDRSVDVDEIIQWRPTPAGRVTVMLKDHSWWTFKPIGWIDKTNGNENGKEA